MPPLLLLHSQLLLIRNGRRSARRDCAMLQRRRRVMRTHDAAASRARYDANRYTRKGVSAAQCHARGVMRQRGMPGACALAVCERFFRAIARMIAVANMPPRQRRALAARQR